MVKISSGSISKVCMGAVLAVMMVGMVTADAIAQGNIAAEQVDIVKAYQPFLSDAEKITFVAEPAATDTTTQPLVYEVSQHLIDVPFVPAQIRAVSLPDETQEALQNNILKAGFGMQLTPLLDLHLHNGRSEHFSYGLNLHHLSSNGSKIDYQDFSNTGGDLFGSTYVGGSVLSGAVGYNHRKIYNYGEEQTDSIDIDKKLLKRTYNLLPVSLTFQNTKVSKDNFDYTFNFKYAHFEGLSKDVTILPEKEDEFNFNVQLDKQIKKIHTAGMDFTFENLHNKKIGVYDTSQSLLSVIPNYRINYKNLYLYAGANVNIFNKKAYVFPQLQLSYNLIGEYLIPYAGWEGGWKPVTLQQLTLVNPYLGNPDASFSKLNEGYAGIKGSYGNNLSYNIRVNLQNRTNLPLYLPDSLQPAYYDVVYYYEANIINVYAEIAYRQSERINIRLSGETNSYDLDFSDKPWGLPKSKLDFTLNYNIQNKIFTQVDFFANSGAFTKLPADSSDIQLKGRADANISLSYNYKKNLVFWLAFNNIFGSNDTPWFNYPTYGFQAMAGIKLKF